ncbi:MAG: CvpA family protein [Bacteroidales bacterium]|nr:CvpA family protein [Bacteroidales bacterium]
MNTLDIIILVCLIPAFILGISKGLVKQLASLAALIIGAVLSCRYAPVLGGWLNCYLNINPGLVNVICFTLIAVLAVILLNLLGNLIAKVIKIATLSWLDKLLGIVFALLKAVIVIGLFITVFDGLNSSFGFVQQEKLDASVMYGAVKDVCNLIFPGIKALFTQNA